ncbi:MAG: hypothetical protein QOI25_1841 [Mycobacterium sp.]|nr:hypothetical protein [Mycobacterium sp.]
MANSLTGDFDFVVEVSDGTLDRLAATMHQNGFSNPATPSLPHIAYFRIGGDPNGVGGERGSVAAQVGVPRVVLIDGATDRFWAEIGFRARYRADPGTTPLADVIHGTIRAMYRFQDIDPTCAGWRDIAGDYLWLRVVPGSVSFDGTVSNDPQPTQVVQPTDEQRVKQDITKQLAALLAGQFQPSTPHPIGKQHRFRRFRTLSQGSALGSSVVAFPFGLGDESPPGDLGSITALFLDGHDFGLAVNSGYIVGAVQTQLDPMIGLQRDFHIHGDAGVGGGLEIDYHVRIDAITAQWLGAPPFLPSTGLIRITAAGTGWATRLHRSGVYNIGSVSLNDLRMTASVEQFVMLQFDRTGQRLTVSAVGSPTAAVSYNGPFAGEVTGSAKDAVAAQVNTRVGSALAQAQTELDKLAAPDKTSALIDVLRTIDESADARFDDAAFRTDGLVLRGSIRLTHRHAPQVSFVKTPAGDGFDAIESWIPGGRIDSFEWTWRWFTNPVEIPPGPPGASSSIDSYLLHRPHQSRTRFGLRVRPSAPLPGLDGNGRICLRINGVHVDQATGALVPVQSVIECAQFGYEFKIPVEMGPYLRVCDPLGAIAGRSAPEEGILRVGAADGTAATQNTLVLHLGEKWNEDAVAALRAGVEGCGRSGAGLLVLVLFSDGALSSADHELGTRMQHLAAALPAPLLVAEDVRDSWSQVLGLDGSEAEPQWRLVVPTGAVKWRHRGQIESDEIAAVLTERLKASRPAEFVQIRPGTALGDQIVITLVAGGCPPLPLRRPGTTGSKVMFVDTGHASAATLKQLERATTEYDPPYIAVVVDGASADEVHALQAELGLDVPMFPDPDGAVTRRAGMRFTPAVVTIDPLGRLREIAPTPDMTSGLRRRAAD